MKTFANLTDSELLIRLNEAEQEYQWLLSEKISRTDKGTKLNYNKYAKLQKLQDISMLNPEGFTVDKNTLEPIKNGYAIGVIETQDSFDFFGLTQVIEFSENNRFIDAIGGWKNKDGVMQYDAVIIVDDEQIAAEIGYRNKQKAIFNLNTGKEIPLK